MTHSYYIYTYKLHYTYKNEHSVFIIIQEYNSSVKYAKHHRDTLWVISVWKHNDQNILNNPKGNKLKEKIKLYHIYYVYIDAYYNKQAYLLLKHFYSRKLRDKVIWFVIVHYCSWTYYFNVNSCWWICLFF